jgi:Lon protease-like protein
MNKIIPIFPLNLVVFPSSKYSLHIFEERYKKMIKKCLEDNIGFGIVIPEEQFYSKIGSYVVIADVKRNYPNGEMDIKVEGKERFYLLETEFHPDGYLLARVESHNDYHLETNIILEEELKVKFEELMEKVNLHLEESFWRSYRKAKNKSYKIAEKSGLAIEQQQKLLALQDENKRLNFLLEHFDKLNKQLSESAALRSIIMNDGYLN